ncbi:hypothetical protein O6H91_18G029400 [Diphasiastrum complanatum]|uniref:Uncharacterized protein n=2 Tax=Diphasiastrum complanatum TaxID=34168 RepID=A0ACC2AZ93_DIPCM|nr:hypothetical protein O6H91_18G029400 [Diphasiastrum complanatum]
MEAGGRSANDEANARAPAEEAPHNNSSSCIRGCCRSDSIPLSLPKSRLHILSTIAQGAESVVYKARWDEKVVALKKPKLSTADDLDRFHKELQLLRKCIMLPSQTRNSSQGCETCKCSDFGLAAYVKDLEKPSVNNWKSIGKPTGGFYKKNMVGTLLYMAPEVLNRELHSEKSDVYGLGITINELFMGTVPYTDRKTEAQAHTILEMNYTEQQLVAAITSGLRPVLAGPEYGCPENLANLIEKCWQGEASQRPSLDSILESVGEIILICKSARKQETAEEASLKVALYPSSELSSNAVDKVAEHNNHKLVQGASFGSFAPKKTQSGVSNWGTNSGDGYRPTLSWGVFVCHGGRETMEDTNFVLPNMGGTQYAHAFGVFDGHRGPEAAEFAAHAIPAYLLAMQTSVSPMEALTASFIEVDFAFRSEVEAQRFRKKDGGKDWHPGCTAATVLFANDRLFAANAGDCRMVLCHQGQAVALSTDHTADCIKERDRIIRAGGTVAWQVDSWRVGSVGLQVTRSIGDDDLKPAVIAEPEIQEVFLSADDEFLVIASDGLWETVSNEDAIFLVKNTVKDAALCSKRLATEAVERGSTDNITVMVIFLRPVSTLERVYYEA